MSQRETGNTPEDLSSDSESSEASSGTPSLVVHRHPENVRTDPDEPGIAVFSSQPITDPPSPPETQRRPNARDTQNRIVATHLRNRLRAEYEARASPSATTLVEGLTPNETRDTELPDAGTPLALRDANPSTKNRKIDDQDMSSKAVTFNGKPTEISNALTHAKVKFIADGLKDDDIQAAYFASLFRGPALTWLTKQIEDNMGELPSFPELERLTREEFALNESARLGQLNRELTALKQKGSAQSYALKFKELNAELRLPTKTATAHFIAGLKPHVQKALVSSQESNDLNDTIAEAIRIDSEIYNISKVSSSYTRTKQGKFKRKDRSSN